MRHRSIASHDQIQELKDGTRVNKCNASLVDVWWQAIDDLAPRQFLTFRFFTFFAEFFPEFSCVEGLTLLD